MAKKTDPGCDQGHPHWICHTDFGWVGVVVMARTEPEGIRSEYSTFLQWIKW